MVRANKSDEPLPARKKRCPSRGPHYSEIYLEDGSEYTEDEVEIIKAMESYIRRTGHKFPKFTEVLAVARALGYRKGQATPGADQPIPTGDGLEGAGPGVFVKES